MIKIENLHKSYKMGSNSLHVLKGINFTVEEGELVAIMGSSGSGKSTLLKMILRLYTPQAGGIRIDGRDIRQIDSADLRHSIGYAPQVNQFFYGTIAQNLRLANPMVTDEEIMHAYSLIASQEGLFCEPASAASVAGRRRHAPHRKKDSPPAPA